MTLRILIRPEAEHEIRDAFAWYERAFPGLGIRFLEGVDSNMVRIAESPQQFVSVDGFRRAVMRTFPYCIYFRIHDDLAIVVAVLHARRSSHRLRGRR